MWKLKFWIAPLLCSAIFWGSVAVLLQRPAAAPSVCASLPYPCETIGPHSRAA